MDRAREHWEKVYAAKAPEETSWHQNDPEPSLSLIRLSGVHATDPIIDVGGGSSNLVDHLLSKGHAKLTVLDLASAALDQSRTRLGEAAQLVSWEVQDVTRWKPSRKYRLWHDRAVFHFLTTEEDRTAYKRTLAAALDSGGVALVGTFAIDGPSRCSNLDVQQYDPDDLTREFEGFDCVYSAKHDHRTPWGAVQQFSWCMLRKR